jgi:hypothetical protein
MRPQPKAQHWTTQGRARTPLAGAPKRLSHAFTHKRGCIRRARCDLSTNVTQLLEGRAHRSVYIVEHADGAGHCVVTIFVDDLGAHVAAIAFALSTSSGRATASATMGSSRLSSDRAPAHSSTRRAERGSVGAAIRVRLTEQQPRRPAGLGALELKHVAASGLEHLPSSGWLQPSHAHPIRCSGQTDEPDHVDALRAFLSSS